MGLKSSNIQKKERELEHIEVFLSKHHSVKHRMLEAFDKCKELNMFLKSKEQLRPLQRSEKALACHSLA
jgi:hypothetical protein